MENYLLADQPSELDRLRLQSLVWEPSGRQLLSKLGDGSGGRALDVGCGALGWLRILSDWVGPSGQVVGTDIDESMLDVARSFLEEEGITNVELVLDDLFDSSLDPQSFDLVHAPYEIAPLGRGREQVAAHRRLVTPGGSLILEEWDFASWHLNSPAAAAERLIRLIPDIFTGLGGEAGRELPQLLRDIGARTGRGRRCGRRPSPSSTYSSPVFIRARTGVEPGHVATNAVVVHHPHPRELIAQCTSRRPASRLGAQVVRLR